MNETFKLKIMHTSDIHGYVLPINYADNLPRNHGMAKISTLIEKYRNNNTLLIDTGDTIQGSPVMYHQAKFNYDEINPMSKVMNYLNYDYIVIGNHEFNYGLNFLDNYLSNVTAKILNTNILKKENNRPLYGKPYDIKIFENGFKLAIIGLTTHYIPNWERPEIIKDLDFLDAATACTHTVNFVKEKENPDYIIVAYHGGFERDIVTGELNSEYTGENQAYMMIANNPDIDLILTGHQHRLMQGRLHNAIYSQPSSNGKYLSMIDLVFIKQNDTWKLINEQMNLLDTEGIKPDVNLFKEVIKYEDETQQFLDEPIGKLLNGDLLFKDPIKDRINKHPLASFINQVQLEYTNADISMCSFGNEVSGFSEVITMRDIIGTYVFPNTLVVKELDGHTLLKSLEKNAEFFSLENDLIVISDKFKNPKMQLYAYDFYDGISYTINLSKAEGNRIENLLYKDKPLNLDNNYKVVMNNYRSAGGGNYHFLKACKIIKDIQVDVIEILSDYIRDKKEIYIKHIDNITIKKG